MSDGPGSGVGAGEFFLGTVDPGEGNATAMTFSAGIVTATIGTTLRAGDHVISVRAKDILGTWSAVKTVTLTVSRPQAPTGLIAPAPTNTDPALSWTASPDAVKYRVYRNGVALTTEPVTNSFTDLGRADGTYLYTVTAVNELGDESAHSDPISVLVDRVAPSIMATIEPPPNGHGWNNTSVVVTFSCDDDSSGIEVCTPPVTVSGQGADQTVSGLAIDRAGNSTSTTVTLNIDKTAPVLGTPNWTINPKPASGSTVLTVDAPDNLSGTTSGEYFIDTDSGAGNGIPMGLNGNTLSTTIGTGLAVGVYRIGIRARDTAGNWSEPAYTMLVIYDSTLNVGITGRNKKDLIPSLANGDSLPGLTQPNQSDAADYGFTVDYTSGVLDPRNDFMFTYNTGSQCNSPHGQNCHSFSVSATGFDWLVIDQTNNSRGRFQGTATVAVDGVITSNPFTIEGIDGDRLGPATDDRLTLRVYAPGANPATAMPIYQASGFVPKGDAVRVR